MASAVSRLTTSYILAEFIPLCAARGLQRKLTLDFITTLVANPLVEIVWGDERLHKSAFALLQQRLDKNYSLCDAVSFVLMRERAINEALTTDKHFAQEGFVKLLESS